MQDNLNLPNHQCKVHISNNGRLSIPFRFRKAAGLKDGDELVLTLENDVIYLKPIKQIITEVQDIVAQYFADDDLNLELQNMRSFERKLELKKFEEK